MFVGLRILSLVGGWPRRALFSHNALLRLSTALGMVVLFVILRIVIRTTLSRLHHPRFLEWIGAPESASLLEIGPGMWLHSLSRDQAMDAALQLHRDVCLMTTNLDVLDQYVLCLQCTASNILELCLGHWGFPSAEVAAGAMGARVRRASVQMEAMGLWRPSLDPVLLL